MSALNGTEQNILKSTYNTSESTLITWMVVYLFLGVFPFALYNLKILTEKWIVQRM